MTRNVTELTVAEFHAAARDGCRFDANGQECGSEAPVVVTAMCEHEHLQPWVGMCAFHRRELERHPERFRCTECEAKDEHRCPYAYRLQWWYECVDSVVSAR